MAASSHPQRIHILCIAGPTASGKSARAVEEALDRDGEIISVDSRQVYRGLDIGTEKISKEAMRGVPHHLIDCVNIVDAYSAGEFAIDATQLIQEITNRGKLPILVGGTHFYFDALLRGLPHDTPIDYPLRSELERLSTDELYARIREKDTVRSATIDPRNRRRLIRTLEIIESKGIVPPRVLTTDNLYACDWIIIDPPREELRKNIDSRLASAFTRGLIEEVQRVDSIVGRTRLNEFGLEYRIVGEHLYGERSKDSLIPALSAKLWQFARRQKAWVRKLYEEELIEVTP